jgi:hypothetical protein
MAAVGGSRSFAKPGSNGEVAPITDLRAPGSTAPLDPILGALRETHKGSATRLSNYVVTDGKCNKPIGIYRHKLDTVKSVGETIFQGDAIDAREYVIHRTIQIRAPIEYPR